MQAVISDFGGVLTTPLGLALESSYRRSGVSLRDLGEALGALAVARGDNPLFELETGALSETEFSELLGAQISGRLGRPVDLSRFGEDLFAAMAPNEPFVAYLRAVRARGHAMAICTNNVREWSARWRAMLPVAELFDVVVDSSELGIRKPDPRIYEATLAALAVPAAEAVFIDDLEINCEAAAALGMHPVWFRSTEQAMADLEAALG